MNANTISILLNSYLSRKQRCYRKITNIRLEYQRLLQKYYRNSSFKNNLIASLLLLLDDRMSINCRLTWSYAKNDKWWREIVPSMTDRQFKNNFRLNRSTFSALLHRIGPHLRRADTTFRETIPVEKRIALALYCLGSTSELRTISNLFGVGISTSCLLLHEFCSTLGDNFFHQFVKFPSTDEEIEDTTTDFLTRHGYPMCLGAVDSSHISIKPPVGFESDYFNYKKHHSVILLAVVNASLQFSYVNVGAPGRSNDSSVFKNSTLAEVIQHEIYSNHFIMVNGVKVQAHLVADSAFCLNRTLMKPYPDRPDTPREYRAFNYRLSRCRCTVERAFGSLKNRFRSLHKKMEYTLQNIHTMIKAATILHNLCILEGDEIEIDWDTPQPTHKKPASNIQTLIGGDVRGALTEYFLQNPL